MLKKTARGFTLVELLIVIAIIGILAAVVALVINPIELTKRSRDANRLTDLANLQQAINVAVQESQTGGTAVLDVLCVAHGVATSCTGDSIPAGTTTDAANRANDGTGWVKVDLSSQALSVPILPRDPVNSGALHYEYGADATGWEISTVLESDQQSPKMGLDGGNCTPDATATPPVVGKYEVGTKLTLVAC